MTGKMPAWWCPSCEQPQFLYRKPCKCGHEPVSTWKCSKCAAIVMGFTCDGCGFTRRQAVRNMRLEKQLSQRVKGGHQTVLQRLRKYIMFHGFNRRIPLWVVEEAWCSALEKLLSGIEDYDSDRGEFLNWAFVVVRNELSNMARTDVTESKYLGLSLDLHSRTGTGGQLLAEKIGTDDSVLDNMLSNEARATRLITMRELAIIHMGTYWKVEGGIEVEKPLYIVCLEAYDKIGGHGWIKAASDATGVPEYTIIRRKDALRVIWEQWQKEEFKI